MSKISVPIRFKKLNDKAVLPKYQSAEAACVDLVATEIEYLDENKVVVKFGFAAAIPPHYKVIIQPRSSFTHKSWIMQNSPGIIDSDYRGEWMAKFEAIPLYIGVDDYGNPSLVYPDFPYKVGDRVVQASVEVNMQMSFTEVTVLETTTRGTGGFGSTGL